MQIDATLGRSEDHLKMLRASADAALLDSEKMDLDLVRENLVQRDDDELIRDDLKEQTNGEWYLLHPGNLAETVVGSPSGIGRADQLSEDVIGELSMTLSLLPPFEQVLSGTDTPWVYYISKNDYYMLVPFTDGASSQFVPEYLDMDLFVFGRPENNPDRGLRWTKPYPDAGGLGMMVSLIIPVYRDDQFLGTIGYDLTFEGLTGYLKTETFAGYDVCVVDDHDQVIAHSILTENPEVEVYTLSSYLAGDTSSQAPTVELPNDGEFHSIDGRTILRSGLGSAPWSLVFLEDRLAWHSAVLLGAVPQFAIVAFCGLLAFFLVRMRDFNTKLSKEVTERKEAETKAVYANQAKSLFLANMSHDLRSPLSVILGFSDLISRDTRLREEHAEAFRMIKVGGVALQQLINDVLDIAKIEAGKMRLSPQGFDFQFFLRSITETHHSLAREQGLDFRFEGDGLPTFVYADEGKLRQVLNNLLGNAIKFTERGEICLEVRRVEPPAGAPAADQVALDFTVQDTGPGISAELIDNIFEPFVRSGPHETGAGLGLAICHQIVQAMGGELTVESAPGLGSTFHFRLTVQEVDAAILPSAAEPPPVVAIAPGQEIPRLLVVDDHDAIRTLLTSLLEAVGFPVQAASNGREALQVFDSWKPHLVWLDMRMPVMDGFETVARIKQTEAGRKTKVIALTAHAFEEERQAILDAGCDDMIRKPHTEHQIFDAMKKHLGLEFVHEKVSTDASVDEEGTDRELRPEQIDAIPEAQKRNLLEAAVRLDRNACLAAVARIAETDSQSASTMKKWVEQYQFWRIEEVMRDRVKADV